MKSNKGFAGILAVILTSLVFGSLGLYAYKSVKTNSPKPADQNKTVAPAEKLLPSISAPKTVSIQGLTAKARLGLAEKLKAGQSEITTKEVESVTWNDASLGCPEPKMFYAQVLTPGYKIILESGGKTYDYRANFQSVRLCSEVK